MKKGGAGGKFTWGDLLAGAEPPAAPVLDHNDPNYGSSDDEGAPAAGLVAGSPGQSQNVTAFKQAVSLAGHTSLVLIAVNGARTGVQSICLTFSRSSPRQEV